LLGAGDLQPERSVNLSAGSLPGRRGLAVTVDFYRIKINDRVLTDNFTGAAVQTSSPKPDCAA
jgi:hypothetical protein